MTRRPLPAWTRARAGWGHSPVEWAREGPVSGHGTKWKASWSFPPWGAERQAVGREEWGQERACLKRGMSQRAHLPVSRLCHSGVGRGRESRIQKRGGETSGVKGWGRQEGCCVLTRRQPTMRPEGRGDIFLSASHFLGTRKPRHCWMEGELGGGHGGCRERKVWEWQGGSCRRSPHEWEGEICAASNSGTRPEHRACLLTEPCTILGNSRMASVQNVFVVIMVYHVMCV